MSTKSNSKSDPCDRFHGERSLGKFIKIYFQFGVPGWNFGKPYEYWGSPTPPFKESNNSPIREAMEFRFGPIIVLRHNEAGSSVSAILLFCSTIMVYNWPKSNVFSHTQQ